MSDPRAVAEILAALSYGERAAYRRAAANVALAPDDRARRHQQQVAERERQNADLIAARLEEVGTLGLEDTFRPYFDAFFQGTEPEDWLEAQTFHYVGDSLVRDFAEALSPSLDPVSAHVVTTLADRDEQDAFALDEISARVRADGGAIQQVAAYARRVIGEALTQTARALGGTEALRELLGGEEGEKRVLLDLLQRHRARLDRMGVEPVDDPPDDVLE
jgi:hypothetical protein